MWESAGRKVSEEATQRRRCTCVAVKFTNAAIISASKFTASAPKRSCDAQIDLALQQIVKCWRLNKRESEMEAEK